MRCARRRPECRRRELRSHCPHRGSVGTPTRASLEWASCWLASDPMSPIPVTRRCRQSSQGPWILSGCRSWRAAVGSSSIETVGFGPARRSWRSSDPPGYGPSGLLAARTSAHTTNSPSCYGTGPDSNTKSTASAPVHGRSTSSKPASRSSDCAIEMVSRHGRAVTPPPLP